MNPTLRPHQEQKSKELNDILSKYKLAYLAGLPRTGKTLTALNTASLYGAKSVLVVTRKKAISSIQSDYDLFNFKYDIEIINHESIHKVENLNPCLVILDEAHSCFLGNTKIDGVKIKDIDLHSSIKSFNFEKQAYEYKKVTNKYKNKLSENLIKIKCNGKEIICTESHKIFTKRGWIRAGEILPADELQVV